MRLLTIFAGPNGAGNSSIIQRVDFAAAGHLLAAAAIASQLHGSNPRLAAIICVADPKQIIRRVHGLVAQTWSQYS